MENYVNTWMNDFGTQLNGDPLTWLLNSDIPGLRYLLFRELFNLSEEKSDFAKEIKAAHTTGPMDALGTPYVRE